MSPSPAKKGAARIPEVVVYTASSASSPARRQNGISLSRAGSSRDAAEGLGRSDPDELAGLSRIEQIKLRARRRAEEDDRARETTRSRTALGGDNDVDDDKDDDDDDALPELARPCPSSSLSSAPTPSPSNRSTHLSSDSDYAIFPWNESPASPSENGGEATPPAGKQRSRRKTARLEPYIFRPSLDPVSDRRRRLQLAKESAAVQAKLMKTEDFKKSAYHWKGDPLDRVLREQRRDRRKGVDEEGLQATIRILEESRQRLEEEGLEVQMEIDCHDDGEVSSEDDTSAPSSLQSAASSPLIEQRRMSVVPPEEKIDRERRRRAIFVNDEGESEQGEEAFDILIKDRDNADRRRQVGETKDIGLEERRFWSEGKIHNTSLLLPDLQAEGSVYSLIREAVSSDQSNLLASILESGALTEPLERAAEDRSKIIAWLLKVAFLTPTSLLSFAALQAMADVVMQMELEAAQVKTVVQQLPEILLSFGARPDVIEACFQTPVSNREQMINGESATDLIRLRKGERVRAVDRLLQGIYLLAEPMKEGASEHRLQMFLFVLRLSADPEHISLGVRLERLLNMLLTVFLEGDACADEEVYSAVTAQLKGMAPSSRLAVVANLPSTSVRSRAIQRCVARHFIVADDVGFTPIDADYGELANVLSSHDPSINVVLAKDGRDFKQVEANVQLLGLCFNDLALQLCSVQEAGEKGVAVKGALGRTVEAYLSSGAGGSALHTTDVSKCKVRDGQIDGLYRIMEALRLLSNQIQDGKGAFLDRSRVKDALQRIRLMILYELAAFSLAGSKTSSTLKQGTLAKWVTK